MNKDKILKIIGAIGIGLGIGLSFGVALGKIWIGLGIGIGVGMCYIPAFLSINFANKKEDSAENTDNESNVKKDGE